MDPPELSGGHLGDLNSIIREGGGTSWQECMVASLFLHLEAISIFAHWPHLMRFCEGLRGEASAVGSVAPALSEASGSHTGALM